MHIAITRVSIPASRQLLLCLHCCQSTPNQARKHSAQSPRCLGGAACRGWLHLCFGNTQKSGKPHIEKIITQPTGAMAMCCSRSQPNRDAVSKISSYLSLKSLLRPLWATSCHGKPKESWVIRCAQGTIRGSGRHTRRNSKSSALKLTSLWGARTLNPLLNSLVSREGHQSCEKPGAHS